MSAAHDVCAYLVRQLVDDPDAVTVSEVETDGGVRLDVQVADGDLGRVIGRRGHTANAIRTVVRAAAAKDGTDAEVEFLD